MKIKLSRLQKVANPFDMTSQALAFDDIDSAITIDEVNDAIARGHIFEKANGSAKENHIAHIAYLVCNYEPQTVVLDTALASENKWWVTQNTETLAAAIIRGEEEIEVLASGDEKLLMQLLGVSETDFLVDRDSVLVVHPEWQAFDWSANLAQDMNDFQVVLGKMRNFDPESSEAVEMIAYVKAHMLNNPENIEQLLDFMHDALAYMNEEQWNAPGMIDYVREHPALIIHIANKSIWNIDEMVKKEDSAFGALLRDEIFNNLEHCKTLFKLNTHYKNLLMYFSDEIKMSDEFLEFYYEEHRHEPRNSGDRKPTLFNSKISEHFFNDENRVKKYLKYGFSYETHSVDSAYEYHLFKNWINNKQKVLEYLAYLETPGEHTITTRNGEIFPHQPASMIFSRIYYALPKELRKDKEVIEYILPHFPDLYKDLPVALRRSAELMQTYLLDSENIETSVLPKETLFALDNPKAIKKLIATNYGFFLHDDIPQSWRENVELLMIHPEYLEKLDVPEHVMEQIYASESYCDRLLKNMPDAYENLPQHLKNNPKYAIMYVRATNNIETLKQHISAVLWNNHEFCIRMFDVRNIDGKQKVKLINENFWDDKRFLLKFFKGLDEAYVPQEVFEHAPEKIHVFLKSADLMAGDYHKHFKTLFLADKLKNQINHDVEDESATPKMKI
jgi:hypothetical protein